MSYNIKDGSEITDTNFEKELKNKGYNVTVNYDEDGNFIVYFTDTTHTYKVDNNKNIIKIEDKEISDNTPKPYTKVIEFVAGSDLEQLGFEGYATDSNSNDVANSYIQSFDGYELLGAWANGYAYLQSTTQYDFSKIDKIEVDVFFGANDISCVNTFSVGLCSSNENNTDFTDELKTTVVNENLTNYMVSNLDSNDAQVIEFDTSEISGNYYLKLLEEHGPTPSTMTVEARIFWIKIYYNDYDYDNSSIEFYFTRDYQEYEVPETAEYKIECFGASGGANNWNGSYLPNYGLGGYASGIIKLTKGEKLYIYVGQRGANGIKTANQLTSTSFNGGGAGRGSSDGDDGGGAGGGATDIRLVSGNWDNFESLKSRIMVAGGGSGGATVQSNFTNPSGGSGGGLIAVGSIWKYSNTEVSNHTYNATQTTGYKFGIGENGITQGNAGGAGAGGGYYGGYSSKDSPSGGAGGGSGYISGYEGCNSISEESTEGNIIHTGSSVHYSGKTFTNGKFKIGVNKGNGYVKITKVDENYVEPKEEEELIPQMNSNSQDGVTINVSDYYSGSTKPYYAFDNNLNTCWSTDTGNYGEHWIEIKFEESKIVKKYSYTIGNCWGTQYEFLLQASTDGENWIDLETTTHTTNSSSTISRKSIFK